jgi:hypothetical protein
MANEVQIICTCRVSKNGVTTLGEGPLSTTMSGDIVSSGVQAIGTSSEQLVFTDMANIGGLWVKNLDATNFVSLNTVSPAVAGDCPMTLLPGESNFIRTRKEAWYAIADTGTVNIQFIAYSL